MHKLLFRAAALGLFVAVAPSLAGCGGAGHATNFVPQTQNVSSQPKGTGASPMAQILAARHFSDLGVAAATTNVHLIVTLAHRDQAELDQLIHDQATPGTADYGRFLTPAQFDQRFGATLQTRQRIEAALTSAGFHVDPQRFGASVVEADGSAASANALFHVTLHSIRESSGRLAHMPATVPVTPAAFQSDVVAVAGLDNTDLITYIGPHSGMPGRINQPVPRPRLNPEITCPQIVGPQMLCCAPDCPTRPPYNTPPPTATPAPTPIPGSQYPSVGPNAPLPLPSGYYNDTTYTNYLTSQGGYPTYTYATDYDAPVQHGFGGSPQFAIGVIDAADVSNSDLAQYYSAMHINRTAGITRIGSGGNSYNWPEEAALDVETLSGMAPDAPVYIYESPSLSVDQMTSAINTVVQQNVVSVLSISYAACEKQGYPSLYEAASGEDSAAAQASAQGITVVAASGDSGGPSYLSGCPSVMAPAASSYVTAVGGTSPDAPNNNMGAAGSYGYRIGHEYAWGQSVPGAGSPCASGFCGTGGGASTHFQTPWQLNACGSGTTWRCVPDISLAADAYHGCFIIFQGGEHAVGGTSFATPLFAAMQAEIDQRQGMRKGNVMPRLFEVWRTYGYGAFASGQPAVFRDMTAGNSGYATTAGYDWASGIGSVDGFALSSVE